MFKPRALCQEHGGDLKTQLVGEALEFTLGLTERGLRYRDARPGPHPEGDRWRVFQFFRECKVDDYWTSMPVTDWTIRYGYVGLVEEVSTGRIVAAQAADLCADAGRTAHALHYAVAEDYRGKGLGARFVRHHAYECMRRGMAVRRGTVDATNTASLYNLLNEVGCIASEFDAYVYAPRPILTVTLPLTYHGLVANRIDRAAMTDWIAKAPTEAYTLVAGADTDKLVDLYEHTDRRIVAIVGTRDGTPLLLAVPIMVAARRMTDLPAAPVRYV